MKVVCAPNVGDPQACQADQTFALFTPKKSSAVGQISANFPKSVRMRGIRPSNRTWDFASIALSAAAADYGIKRSTSPDGWTRQIELNTAVLDPAFWETQADGLRAALNFLTGDIWTLFFSQSTQSPPIPSNRVRHIINGDSVCLFSGGADSLVGAINLVRQGRTPILASQIASGDRAKQIAFAQRLNLRPSHLQLTHAIRPAGPAERSQRSRPIIFLAYGLLAAMHLSDRRGGSNIDLIVPENGFISLNVPLTPLRIGSLSSIRRCKPV
jgi:hypothetical protein